MQGYVYILTNPAMPGLIKIGKSARLPDERADELHSTGVPLPFEIEWFGLFTEMDSTERKLHQLFATSRINAAREFFRVELMSAMDAARALSPNAFGSGAELRQHISDLEKQAFLARFEQEKIKLIQAASEGNKLKSIRSRYYCLLQKWFDVCISRVPKPTIGDGFLQNIYLATADKQPGDQLYHGLRIWHGSEEKASTYGIIIERKPYSKIVVTIPRLFGLINDRREGTQWLARDAVFIPPPSKTEEAAMMLQAGIEQNKSELEIAELRAKNPAQLKTKRTPNRGRKSTKRKLRRRA